MEIEQLITRCDLGVSLWRDGVPYFNRESAMAVVAACEQEKVAILGMEGFDITLESICPRMDWIADFSPYARSMDHRGFVDISARYARQFLGMPNSEGVMFEFCIE